MNETKYTVKFTTVFRKDYKKAKKRRLPLEKLKEVVDLLAMGQPLPERNRDHALTGDWVGPSQPRFARPRTRGSLSGMDFERKRKSCFFQIHSL